MAIESTALAVWEPDSREMDIYRRHFAPQSTTNDEWDIFLETCRTYRISPIRRQIYLVGRWDNVKKRMVNTPQISIGTLRLLALRTHEFEGTTEPEWADIEGNWYTCWPERLGKHPYAARVGIYRKGFRKPVWGVVYFHELAQKTKEGNFTKFWNDSGIHQIGKCAEADGLRKAFEEECGGVYLHEEMLQADSDNPVVSIYPEVDEADSMANDALRESAKNKQSKPPVEQPPVKPTDQKQSAWIAKAAEKLQRDISIPASFEDAERLIHDLNNEIMRGKQNRVLNEHELAELKAAFAATYSVDGLDIEKRFSLWITSKFQGNATPEKLTYAQGEAVRRLLDEAMSMQPVAVSGGK